MYKKRKRLLDRNAEIAAEARLPHSVVKTLIEGLAGEGSDKLRQLIDLGNTFDTDNLENDLERETRFLRYDLIRLMGVLEYHAVEIGVPEREVCVITENGLRKLEHISEVSKMAELFREMYFAYREKCLDNYRMRPRHNKIHNCMEYIENHTSSRFDTAMLADLFGYNPSYLCQKFKAETGMTIRQYSMECRLSEAANLLNYSDRTISEIASFLCFANQSHFQRKFKEKYGMTPAEWRKSNERTEN